MMFRPQILTHEQYHTVRMECCEAAGGNFTLGWENIVSFENVIWSSIFLFSIPDHFLHFFWQAVEQR